MTTTPPYRLRRLGPGAYETRDGRWAIVHNPAGWVFYDRQDPSAADICETLGEVRDYFAQRQEA